MVDAIVLRNGGPTSGQIRFKIVQEAGNYRGSLRKLIIAMLRSV